MTVPERVVLPYHPQKYRYQGFKHCGAFAVQGILEAYGKPVPHEPSELHTSQLALLTGCSPTSDYYAALLAKHGVPSTLKSAAHLPANERIPLLQSLLARGTPVILSVGNYFHRVDGHWRGIKGQFASHWITLWGYDRPSSQFFLYDSLVPPGLSNHPPIGNVARSFSTVFRIWEGTVLTRLFIGRYSYIETERP